MFGQPSLNYARLVGTEPNLTACKKELCRFFAFIEKEKAVKMREEGESADGEPKPSDEEESFTSKLLSCARMMAAMRVEAYFSEENQQKLKDTEEGRRAWERSSTTGTCKRPTI